VKTLASLEETPPSIIWETRLKNLRADFLAFLVHFGTTLGW